jgi:hypothetical protein
MQTQGTSVSRSCGTLGGSAISSRSTLASKSARQSAARCCASGTASLRQRPLPEFLSVAQLHSGRARWSRASRGMGVRMLAIASSAAVPVLPPSVAASADKYRFTLSNGAMVRCALASKGLHKRAACCAGPASGTRPCGNTMTRIAEAEIAALLVLTPPGVRCSGASRAGADCHCQCACRGLARGHRATAAVVRAGWGHAAPLLDTRRWNGKPLWVYADTTYWINELLGLTPCLPRGPPFLPPPSFTVLYPPGACIAHSMRYGSSPLNWCQREASATRAAGPCAVPSATTSAVMCGSFS